MASSKIKGHTSKTVTKCAKLSEFMNELMKNKIANIFYGNRQTVAGNLAGSPLNRTVYSWSYAFILKANHLQQDALDK